VNGWRTRVEAAILNTRQSALDKDEWLINSLPNGLLPLVAALSKENKRPLRILDFGGGMGVGFLSMIKCLPAQTGFEFHIVEDEESCSACSKMFRDFSNLHFHSSLPATLADVDIVHLCSALQYIEDYQALLGELAKLRPKYVFLVSLQAGNNPTFASAQLNFEDGSVVPCWFFNLNEIIQLMNENGYELFYKSDTDRKYDMSNFDERFRVSRYCNLLFIHRFNPDQNT